MSKGDKILLISLAIGGVAIMALFGWLIYRTAIDGERRCASIGAEYRSGGRTSFCVKPDGSMWALP